VAALFCFSLPVEPIVQRLLGYGLQQLSAGLACSILTPFFADLVCTGVRLQVANQDVLVDLPCSGAQLMSTTALVTCLVNALARPGGCWGLASILFSLAVALLGNAVRVSLLAAGIAKESTLGFSVMAPVPHESIGLVVVFATSALIVCFSRYYRIASHATSSSRSALANLLSRRRATFAFLFLTFALTIGAIHPQPVDKSPPLPPPEMPRVAAGFLRQSDALTLMETDYFTRYGGSAARASYGPFGLLLVSTASPLRHLHDPTICLSAMGYSVQLLGTDHNSGATVYRASLDTNESLPEPGAVDAYTIYVTYLSSSGVQALSIAEVVWLWAKNPREHWTMVQRIVPEHATVDTDSAAEFESVMRRSFSIQTHPLRSTL
jgi:exosortase/archaeosortase family protein